MSPLTRPDDSQLDSAMATEAEADARQAAHYALFHSAEGHREPKPVDVNGYPTGLTLWDAPAKTVVIADMTIVWSNGYQTATVTTDYNKSGALHTRIVDVQQFDANGAPVSASFTVPVNGGGW